MLTPERRQAIFDSIRWEITNISDSYLKIKGDNINLAEHERLDTEIQRSIRNIKLLLKELDALYSV